jgi:hypothetical protein
MEVRVGDEPEVREPAALDEAPCRARVEAEVGYPDVRRDDPERIAEERQRLRDSARGLERAPVVAAFARVRERDSVAAAVAERVEDVLFVPVALD